MSTQQKQQEEGMTAPTYAWAIKAPDGGLNKYGIGRTRKHAIESFCWGNWQLWYRRGYRCVKVQITEMEEGK